jgi:serine/threonine protein kinase/tetratricopeptide (TPR) repeat protein
MNADPDPAKAVFLEAVERHAADQWPAFLDRACAGQPDLRGRVEVLLAAHRQVGTITPSDFADSANPALESTADLPSKTERPGTIIGPYKLIEPIGEGGMGTVWMAQQTQPVKRAVAVKMIKSGMDSKQVLARFEAERQALALMDHPNIAKVLDAGATTIGRPYFVMELVKGVPITKYCDERRLTPNQRLELFVPVCQAIQHAHQKGIIHRDIKPSNILIALYDGKPVPKVIDFGVAKAAGQQLTDKTLMTGFGSVVGTLEYMSPEQAELNQLDIDTRSDIYSLGVVLYELLTGGTPLDKKRLKQAAFAEVLRIIREEEPQRPSTRLSNSTDSLPSVSAQRQMEPAKLTKLVRGELDWIVMKALEKDRNRRYETANGFGMDVQRYLAGEPVLAGPASQWYRLRKLVRRHRGPVAAAGLVFLTLLGGIAGTTWGLVQARHQRKVAEGKTDEAVNESVAKGVALVAEQQARADETKARLQAFAALRSMTTNFIERKFAQGTELTEDDRAFLRDVISQYDAFAQIKGDDPDSRAVRAEGRFRVGVMRYKLGELQEAEKDYDEAVSIWKQLVADCPTRPEFRQDLAISHNNRGVLIKDTRGLQEAEKDFDQALNIEKKLAADFTDRPEFRRHLAKSYGNRGNMLRTTGHLEEAEHAFDQALSIQKQLVVDFPLRPEFRQELAQSHNNRGVLLLGYQRRKEAEQDYNEALRIRKQLAAEFRSQPEFRQELAHSYTNRGMLLLWNGRRDEAEQDYDQSLGIDKQLVAEFPMRPEFRQHLAQSHTNRGQLRSATGRRKEAERDYDQAVSIQEQLAAEFPTRHQFRQDLVASHLSRGMLRGRMGRREEAEKDYDQALDIQKQALAYFPGQPDRHNDVARTCVDLASLQRKQGDWAAAKRLLLEGQPHHLAALKANPNNSFYRLFYGNNLKLLITVHAGLLEQADAVRVAEMVRDLDWNQPVQACEAACCLCRCVPIVAKHDKLDDKQRKEAAQFYCDRAMKFLRDGVSKGYKDVTPFKVEPSLDPLREREDFQKLVAELEGKGK